MREPKLGRCRLGIILDAIGWSQQELADHTGIGKDQVSRYLSEDPRQNRKISLWAGILITDTIYAKTGHYFHPRELYENTNKQQLGRSEDKS